MIDYIFRVSIRLAREQTHGISTEMLVRFRRTVAFETDFHQDDILSRLFPPTKCVRQISSGGVIKLDTPDHRYGNMTQLTYNACNRGKHIHPALLARFGVTMASMIALVHANTRLLGMCPAEACASNEWRWCI